MIVLLAGAALMLFAVWLWREAGPGTPRYGGQDVYYWMFQTRSSSPDSNEGLKAMGTNAVPYLARALAIQATTYERRAWVRHPWVQAALAKLRFGFNWTRSAEEVRQKAAFSLLAFGSEARSALPELHAALTDPVLNDFTRQTVVQTLGEIGPPPESLPYLVAAWQMTTNRAESGVHHDLVFALRQISHPDLERCLPIFLAELESPDLDLRHVAAWGANRLGAKAQAATPALRRMLATTNGESQFTAAVVLGRVSNPLPELFPRLRELTQGPEAKAAAGAALTLWRWGQAVDESVAILTGLLSQKEGKGLAAEYLGVIGPDAAAAVPALTEASQKDIGASADGYGRVACALAVIRIAGTNEVVIKELEAALRSSDNAWIRGAMARNLGQLGRLGAPFLPALRQNLQDPEKRARIPAAQAIESIEKALREAPKPK